MGGVRDGVVGVEWVYKKWEKVSIGERKVDVMCDWEIGWEGEVGVCDDRVEDSVRVEGVVEMMSWLVGWIREGGVEVVRMVE